MRPIDADKIAPKLEGKFNQDMVRYAPTITLDELKSYSEEFEREINELKESLDIEKGSSYLWRTKYYDLLADKLDVDIEWFNEILQAQIDKKLIVLPCQKGDTLFLLTSDSPDGIEETKCKKIVIVNRDSNPCPKVIAKCMYDDWGEAHREIFPEAFGKTVFLIRKEAEAALEVSKEG